VKQAANNWLQVAKVQAVSTFDRTANYTTTYTNKIALGFHKMAIFQTKQSSFVKTSHIKNKLKIRSLKKKHWICHAMQSACQKSTQN